MSDLLTAAKEALEVLEAGHSTVYGTSQAARAITALRQAIGQEGRDWSLLEAAQESLREHMAEIKRLRELLEQQPAAREQHPDDAAVDRFAAAMKSKLANQRAKGYGGWDDPKQCPAGRLQNMLVDHIPKGDPVDVGNFAMMLFCRAEPTRPQPAAWVGLTDEDRKKAFESMPDMLEGFLKKWGWVHFSKAIENILKEKNTQQKDAP